MAFAIVTMTDEAVQRVREICAAKNALGLKLSVRKGGCAGLEYAMDLIADANSAMAAKMDKAERNGALIYIEPKDTLFLLGTEIGYEETTLHTGFTFKNPNQTSACGCGESVEITPANAEMLQKQLHSAA